jgi:hypothetical protein
LVVVGRQKTTVGHLHDPRSWRRAAPSRATLGAGSSASPFASAAVAPPPALLEPAARDPRSPAEAPRHACRWRRRDRYQVVCADRAPPFLPRTGTLARSNATGTTPPPHPFWATRSRLATPACPNAVKLSTSRHSSAKIRQRLGVRSHPAAQPFNQTFGKGTLLGQIGLFTPDGRRTRTIRCKTDVQTGGDRL